VLSMRDDGDSLHGFLWRLGRRLYRMRRDAQTEQPIPKRVKSIARAAPEVNCRTLNLTFPAIASGKCFSDSKHHRRKPPTSRGIDLDRSHFTIFQRIDPLLPSVFDSAATSGPILLLSLQREPAADWRGGHTPRSISAADSLA